MPIHTLFLHLAAELADRDPDVSTGAAGLDHGAGREVLGHPIQGIKLPGEHREGVASRAVSRFDFV